MSLLQFPSPRRTSASSLSQPMRPTICSYKKGTWNGQYECLNRQGIAFGDRRGGDPCGDYSNKKRKGGATGYKEKEKTLCKIFRTKKRRLLRAQGNPLRQTRAVPPP